MNFKASLSNSFLETPKASSFWLRQITGWALIAAGIGVFIDATLCNGCTEGTFGLVPLYLGFFIGSISLVILLNKILGWLPALLAALGVAGILYFMGSYPNGAEGWIGGILVGLAFLFLPLSGRFISVLWVSVGILGFPEFHARPWDMINAFTVFGVANAITGLFILFALPSPKAKQTVTSARYEA